MSLSDAFQFPRKLSVIRPSEDQSPYTRMLNFTGSYNGYLAGALIAYPSQSVGAQIMMVKKQIVFGQAGGLPVQSINNALLPYWIGNAYGHWGALGMTSAYVPVVDGSATGQWEIRWDSDGWDPDSVQQIYEETKPKGAPYTMSGRINSMYMEVVRNTVSATSTAISGTCNSARVDDLELYGDIDLGSQFCKRYASPDKDYACNVSQQNGAVSIGGCDYGRSYVAINPWQTSTSQDNEVLYRSVNLETAIPLVGFFAVAGSGTTPTVSNFTFYSDNPSAVNVNGGNVDWWAFTSSDPFGPGGTAPPQDIYGTIGIAGSSVVMQMFVSPYLTSSGNTSPGQYRITDKCPAANPFDTPSLALQWRVATAQENVRVTFRCVHIYAQHSATVSNDEANQTIYDTVAITKEERVNGNSNAGWQYMSTTFERPIPVFTPATSLVQAKPKAGLWVGCMVFAYYTCSQGVDSVPVNIYFERYTLSYRFKVNNPAHVISWEKRAVSNVDPLIVSGSMLVEVKLSNEARAYAAVSKYPRSMRFDDLLEAQQDFFLEQKRKTSYDKTEYEREEGVFAAALSR